MAVKVSLPLFGWLIGGKISFSPTKPLSPVFWDNTTRALVGVESVGIISILLGFFYYLSDKISSNPPICEIFVGVEVTTGF